jgi:hypothetical protein
MARRYRNPAAKANVPLTEFDQPLFPIPDGMAEKRRTADVITKLHEIRRTALRTAEVVNIGLTLISRGFVVPDVAQALGMEPVRERATEPLFTWRLRTGSNMDVIATMLEEAGARGVTERRMVEHLTELGRLGTAKNPRRSVHWTVTELQKRTKCVEQRSADRDARWYCNGRFNVWRRPAAQKTAGA